MAKQLSFLDEALLRFRIVSQHAEVYLASDPTTTLGSQYLGRIADIRDHDLAWEMIDRYLGHLMPADLVDEESLDHFDGIAYIGGGFSYIPCPKCHQPLRGQEHDWTADSYSLMNCPHCGTSFNVSMTGQPSANGQNTHDCRKSSHTVEEER